MTSYIQNPFAFDEKAFNGIGSSCILYVPAGTRDAYIAAGWTEEIFGGGVIEMGASQESLSGDANADGSVNVSDYLAIANFILGQAAAGFDEAAADVNADDEVNVSDYVGVANIILYGNYQGTSGNAVKSLTREPVNSGWMSLSETDGAGVALYLHDNDGFCAFQMDIELPYGVEIVEADMAGAGQTKNLSCVRLDERHWRLLYGTLSNKDVQLQNGELLRLRLASSVQRSGDRISVDNILLVKSNAMGYSLHPVWGGLSTAIISVERPDGVNDVYYDLSGRPLNKTDVKEGVYLNNGKKVYIRR